MKKEVKRFINASVHTRGCNLRCDYCYLSYYGGKNDIGINALRYPIEVFRKAFSKERLGVCDIELIGDGETLMPADIVPLVKVLLGEGHYLKITTNGTLTDKIREIVEWVKEEKKENHIWFQLSLHYLELKRLNLLDEFAKTARYIKDNGIDVLLAVVVGPSYMPYIEDIKRYSDMIGANVRATIARDDKPDGTYELLRGEYKKEEIYAAAKKLQPTEEYDERWEEFNCKSQGFCYAGKWSFSVDLTTGLCTQCFANDANKFNFYEELDKELELEAVGDRCKSPYCKCGWKNWYNVIPDEAKEKKNMYADLSKTNPLYTDEEKEECNKKNIFLEQLKINSLYISRCFYEKDYETGFRLAEKFLENDLNPNNYYVASLVVKYGYALMETGELEKALDLASCYDDLNYLADYCMMLGSVYLKTGMVENAIKLFEDATQRYATYEEGTNTWLPLYNLGVIYECLGEIDVAKEYYEKCGNYQKAKARLNEIG